MDNELETLIQEKRLDAPRITPQRVQEVIKEAQYHREAV